MDMDILPRRDVTKRYEDVNLQKLAKSTLDGDIRNVLVNIGDQQGYVSFDRSMDRATVEFRIPLSEDHFYALCENSHSLLDPYTSFCGYKKLTLSVERECEGGTYNLVFSSSANLEEVRADVELPEDITGKIKNVNGVSYRPANPRELGDMTERALAIKGDLEGLDFLEFEGDRIDPKFREINFGYLDGIDEEQMGEILEQLISEETEAVLHYEEDEYDFGKITEYDIIFDREHIRGEGESEHPYVMSNAVENALGAADIEIPPGAEVSYEEKFVYPVDQKTINALKEISEAAFGALPKLLATPFQRWKEKRQEREENLGNWFEEKGVDPDYKTPGERLVLLDEEEEQQI
ncbi:MAG: hypothetical protein ACOCQ4_01375 [bacterium]